ncbi:putative ribonuclease H-like domain-containing protein [Tanacetum coccineum]
MCNKSDLDTLSMDDLYNNLKVYEAEIKGQSSSNSNSHNVAFVSSDNTSSTNEAVNTTNDVSAASSQGQATSSTYGAGMLYHKGERFLKKTGRNLNFNGKETVSFDKTKVECYNCHMKGHFDRECKAPKSQGIRNRYALRRNAPMDTSTTNALVVQDGIGGYDWSFQAEEGITNFALMAYTSQGSSSSDSEVHTCSKDCLKSYETLQKQYDQQREALNKSNLEIIGYQMGLESLEARIVVHEKNEAVYEEDIAFLKYDVQVKDISIKELKNQLEEALKEKDDLKLKLEKFDESSKNLTKLINSQISAKDKASLGYDSQMNESEVVHSVFNSRESDVDDSPINDRFKTGKGFHAVPSPYTRNYMPSRPDLSFAGLDDFVYKTKMSEIETSISKNSKDIVEKPKTIRSSAPIIKDWDTDSDNDSVFRPKSDQTKPKLTKVNFVKSNENIKSVIKENTNRQVEYPRKKKPLLNNKGRVTGQREIRPVWNNAQRVKHQNKLAHPHPKRKFVPTAVLTKSGPVNTTAPKSKVNDALPKTYSYFKAHSQVRRAFNQKSTAKTNNLNEKVKTAKVNNVTTAGPKAVFSAAKGNGENAVKYMTGNKSFLTDYKEINGGFVAFGGSPKGGKITKKGKIRTVKLDFKDVYFVKELKFNLFSVSQMCDKKNSVLFTETECLVLSPDFKLLDERGLTCLFAKATIDESNLWHRRLGHINFKTMNKLVRGNLVRGLPSKLFENDHTCVACQKGKQHKASCKTKLVSSISQPLQMLHMDLFGPTSVRSINHKTYCLVVTDDFSRFSWVFFLATKDETSGILKTFITGIENQINHKVKIIRCDNGTEFKNNDMNQFCGMKGIKREFSVARTPQQNRVAERKNRTLIEAARTMLADSLLPTTFWAEAVNTACYVQNRVLVTKPHNKTPYKLLHGRPPSISFMRPFGCPVTILNTLDPLGKFDGKADEGFLVGYSINSKAFRVFNTRTRKVEENLHITFLENKPNVAGSGPDWLFDIDLLTNSMNYEPVTAGNQTNGNAGIKDNVDAVPTQQYILLPLLSDSPQSSEDAVADDAGKKTTEEPANEGERNGQEKEGGASNKEGDQNVQDLRAELDKLLVQQKEGYANSTNRVSTVSPSVSAAGQSFINADDLPTDPLMPDLEDTTDLLNTGIFSGAYDDEDVGAEADLNNLETTMNVSPIPTTRMHSNTNKALLKDEEAEDVDVHLYRSMIGSLMYLTAFRPDIMFATATVKTVDNGEQEITATVDGKEFTITEASVRRHLQLANTSELIPNVPDEAIYEEWDDRVERATTTAASLDAAQASGAKKLRGVPLLRLGLRGKVESLKADLKQTKQVYGAVYTKPIMKVLQCPLIKVKKELGYEAVINIRLQEHLDEEERRRITRVHEEASSFNIVEWENIQAIIEVDEELAQMIQAEEREEYSEAEKARLLAELIN